MKMKTAKQKTKLVDGSRTCYECKGSSEGKRENYTYAECGLKNVVLSQVLVYRCIRCGAQQVEIPNMEGLHRTIALALLCKKGPLVGDEIRFLRSVAGHTSTALAKRLAVTKNALSRWEHGAKIGLASERAIRAVCGMDIIGEIVNQQGGAVNPKDVNRTLQALQGFFAKLADNSLMDFRGEGGDTEKLTIDPSKPFTFASLPPLVMQESPTSVLQ